MMDQKTGGELIAYFRRLVSFYQKFLEMETGKYQILKQNHLEKLNQTLKKEQAFTLKARGLEVERKKRMEKTEAPNAVFRDLIPLFPPDQQKEARSLYHTLSITLNHLKLVSDKSNRLIRLKLHRISSLKERAESPAAAPENAKPAQKILSKKV